MRRLIALTAALGALAASPVLAQQQSTTEYNDIARTQPPPMENGIDRKPTSRGEYAKAADALKAKDYRGAIHSLGQIVDRYPDDIVAWRLLAAAYAGAEKWGYSQHAYERVLKTAPNDVVSHAGRGEALLALNDPKAQEEAAWLKARTEACADTCPDATLLKTLETRGPFAKPNAG